MLTQSSDCPKRCFQIAQAHFQTGNCSREWHQYVLAVVSVPGCLTRVSLGGHGELRCNSGRVEEHGRFLQSNAPHDDELTCEAVVPKAVRVIGMYGASYGTDHWKDTGESVSFLKNLISRDESIRK